MSQFDDDEAMEDTHNLQQSQPRIEEPSTITTADEIDDGIPPMSFAMDEFLQLQAQAFQAETSPSVRFLEKLLESHKRKQIQLDRARGVKQVAWARAGLELRRADADMKANARTVADLRKQLQALR